MARFILKDKHYLNVPGTIWEQKETSQQTGKQYRHDYAVGLYLDPNDPADHNYPMTRQIIVTTKRSNQYPADIVFVGPPTFDMEPIDDEAQEMMAKLGRKGDPFTELPSTVGETFSERVMKMLEAQLLQAQSSTAPALADDRVTKLEAELAELKQLLLNAQAAKEEAKSTLEKRRA